MRGYYGIGIYHPKAEVNVGTLWRSAHLFGAAFIFTVGRRYQKQASDTACTSRHVPLYHYTCYEDFYEHLPDECRLVCVEGGLVGAATARSLSSFVHPRQAVYLLGAEDHGIPPALLERQIVVSVPTLRPESMNVAVAGSIVLYDRFVKAEMSVWGHTGGAA